MKYLASVFAFCLPVNFAQGQSLASSQPALDSLIQVHRIPALLAAVIEPTGIRYLHGGVRQQGKPAPAAFTDFFHIGSNTKGITSFIAAKLVEQGKIRWDSPLATIVPELRGKVRTEYAAITLADLLSHRAGIRPYASGPEIDALPSFSGSISQKRLQFALHTLQESPAVPNQPPFAYSNGGYALAALMLERVSHRSWEELVARTFRTLGYRHRIGFPNRQDATQPWGHWLESPTDSVFTALEPSIPYHIQDFLAPSGDVAMPLPDYARFVQLHLLGLLEQANYLRAATYQQLHFGQEAYAYGWGNGTFTGSGARFSFHDGTAGTFFCHTFTVPSQKVAFVVITNAGGAPAQAACYALRRHLLRRFTAHTL